MKILREYINNITMYIILTGFISIIMPDNSYRKYIILIMGVILVIMVTEPIEKGFELLW